MLEESSLYWTMVPEDIEIGNAYDVKMSEKPWYLKEKKRQLMIIIKI